MAQNDAKQEVERREADRDEALRRRAKEDPGAGYTQVKQERSRNTEFAQPPRPSGARNPPEEP